MKKMPRSWNANNWITLSTKVRWRASSGVVNIKDKWVALHLLVCIQKSSMPARNHDKTFFHNPAPEFWGFLQALMHNFHKVCMLFSKREPQDLSPRGPLWIGTIKYKTWVTELSTNSSLILPCYKFLDDWSSKVASVRHAHKLYTLSVGIFRSITSYLQYTASRSLNVFSKQYRVWLTANSPCI